MNESLQRRGHHRHTHPVSLRHFRRRERPVGARVAQHEVAGGVGHRLQVALRHTARHRRAECVAVARGVLDGDPPLVARDPDADRAPLLLELSQHGGGRTAQRGLGRRQVAEHSENVSGALDVAHLAVVRQPLQLGFDLVDSVGVEQLTKLRRAQQLGEQRAVERQGGRPSLGERLVAFVHELADVAEQQRPSHRRWLLRLDVDDAH